MMIKEIRFNKNKQLLVQSLNVAYTQKKHQQEWVQVIELVAQKGLQAKLQEKG